MYDALGLGNEMLGVKDLKRYGPSSVRLSVSLPSPLAAGSGLQELNNTSQASEHTICEFWHNLFLYVPELPKLTSHRGIQGFLYGLRYIQDCVLEAMGVRSPVLAGVDLRRGNLGQIPVG